MNAANDALHVLVPLLYLGTIFAYHREVDGSRTGRVAARLLPWATLAAHGAQLWVRGAILGQAPWTTYYDSLSALAFVVLVTYLVVETATRIRSTGVDLLPVPFVMATYAAAFGPHVPKADPMLDSPKFLAHTLPAIGGIAAIIVSGIYGMLYLRLEATMRRKEFEERIFRRLPNLDVLSRMNFYAAASGLVLVTAAIGWGASWYGDEFGRVNVFEPKIFLTLSIWVILLLPLIGRLVNRWPDRATAVLTVITMFVAVVSIVVPILPFVGFHGHS